MDSKLFSLNWTDFGKGALLAIAIAVIGAINQLLKDKGFDISVADLQIVGGLAIKAFIAYIAITFGSNSKGKFGKAE